MKAKFKATWKIMGKQGHALYFSYSFFDNLIFTEAKPLNFLRLNILGIN